MNEKIVRSILGVLLTKAAILIGWYAYEKYAKEEQSSNKDVSEDLEVPNADVDNDVVDTVVKEPIAEEVVKPKRPRKPRVLEMKVEEPVVKPKRTRKTKPASE